MSLSFCKKHDEQPFCVEQDIRGSDHGSDIEHNDITAPLSQIVTRNFVEKGQVKLGN